MRMPISAKWIALALLAMVAPRLVAQTSSGIARHTQWGASLPATCSPDTGDIWFLTSGTKGMYSCNATNTWTFISSGTGLGSVTNVATTCGVATSTGSPISTTGTVQEGFLIDNQTGSGPYAIPSSDCGKGVYRNNAAAVLDTIATPSGSNFAAGWSAWYTCQGAGGCTITPASPTTINGGTAVVMPQGTTIRLQSDGTNYKWFGDVRANSIPCTVTLTNSCSPVLTAGADLVVPATTTATATVSITTASNVQTLINSNPAGSTFNFAAGTYRMVSFTPKNNDIFIAVSGVIMNGSTVLTGSTFAGGLYQYAGQTPTGTTGGQCDSTHPLCIYPQDVYFDNVPLTRVSSTGAVITGTWFWDMTAHIIYLADNPSGHTVELSVTPIAVDVGTATGVTVTGFTIEKYASPTGQTGAIGGVGGNTGWIVTNNEVRLSHSGGINAGDNSVIRNNFSHNNGNKGIGCTGNNILIQSNELSFNNYAGFNPQWESGGSKCSATDHLTYSNNNSHDNLGPGLWVDEKSTNVTITGNVTVNNFPGAGIQLEISKGAYICYNVSAYNYVNPITFGFGSQIQIQNSQNAEVCYNWVATSLGFGTHSIFVIQQDRSMNNCPWSTACPTANNYIHHNNVVFSSNNSAVGGTADFDLAGFLTQNNRFDYNAYHGNALNVNSWLWVNGSGQLILNFSAWQALPQDAHSTSDNIIPQIPAPIR